MVTSDDMISMLYGMWPWYLCGVNWWRYVTLFK